MTNNNYSGALAPLGLTIFGHVAIDPNDELPVKNGTLLLIGPNEPAFWPLFSNSSEYRDGIENPLDRWSKRVLNAVADQFDGHALFPSDGPPFHPFFTWAIRSGQSFASPIGFLVHAQAGLFVSFRGAILIRDQLAPARPAPSPCDTCLGQPCTHACPIDAFADGYDVPACKARLHTPAGRDSMENGCAARRACPIGQGNRLPAQSAFHMEAFR